MYSGYTNPYMGQASYMMPNNYGQFNQPSPYAQNVNQAAPSLSGRFVNDFNEVSANDVPMNGCSAVFVKSDLDEIQLRKWNANGTIDRIVFKPLESPRVDNLPLNAKECDFDTFNHFLEGITDKLEELSAKVDKISRSNTRIKKEMEINES